MANNSKLSTPVLNVISDSGHNSQFLRPPNSPKVKNNNWRFSQLKDEKEGEMKKKKNRDAARKQKREDAKDMPRSRGKVDSNSLPLKDRC